MSPKYRGRSEDWLDDDAPRASRRGLGDQSRSGKKSDTESDRFIPREEGNGTVTEIFPDICRVKLDGGSTEGLLCGYRRAEVQARAKKSARHRERSPVCVGDRVKAEISGQDSGVVVGVCERINSLSRVAPGESESIRLHIIAANLDLLLVVVSAKLPEFNPFLVDRFLIAAQASGIPAAVCVTKMDLLSEDEKASPKPWLIYEKAFGIQVFEVSNTCHLGHEALRQVITGKRVGFCGHSGVGKTTLLTELLGRPIGKIGEVNTHTGKGRHTTSAAVLLEGPSGSEWIDTPGVREFALHQVEPENLASYFPEFLNRGCQVAACRHVDEPGCAVQDDLRHSSYLRIYRSLTS